MRSGCIVVCTILALLVAGCSGTTGQSAARAAQLEASVVFAQQDDGVLRQALEAEAGPKVYITRIERRGDQVLAAVLEEPSAAGGAGSLFYTTRGWRQADDGGWEAIEPDVDAWGAQQSLDVAGLHFDYRAFDEPYVRAVAPRVARVLPEMAADFGITLTEGEVMIVQVAPLGEAADAAGLREAQQVVVPSPLTPGFPLGVAQSPEEFLLGYVTDSLGHALLARAFGEGAKEMGRLALAHPAIQWEVHQAVGRDFGRATVRQVGAQRTPLATLLDPTRFSAEGSQGAERDLFLRFAIAQYGPKRIAPYLRAVFGGDSAEELVRAAFGEELGALEPAWHAWLDQRTAVEGAWDAEEPQPNG
jgi:hypothetical protein